MLAYIVRRLLLMVPTLFGIMVINFVIVQAAPGGPVEQLIAQIQGRAVEATARVSGAGAGEVQQGGGPSPARTPDIAAPRVSIPNSLGRSSVFTALTSRPISAFSK